MKLAGIVIVAICCITTLAVCAVLTGFNTHLVTGTVSAIVGIVSGCIAYYKGKSKAAKEVKNDTEKKDKV